MLLLQPQLAVAAPADVRAAAALDSLWSTFWSPEANYLRLHPAAAAASSKSSEPELLPYWNYQEAMHAMALGATQLDYKKYGPRLAAMVAGQTAMDSARSDTAFARLKR